MNQNIYKSFNVRLRTVREHIEDLEHLLQGYKQAHDTFRESEERFRLLVEQVQDYAIFMLNPEGHVVSWNAGAERIKGYTAEEILRQHFSRFYPPEAIASGKPAQALAAARAEGRTEDEDWRVRKDGSRFWANVVITALHDDAGQLRGFAKITRDMTERKQTEEDRMALLRREQTARGEAEQTTELLRHLQLLTDKALAHLSLDDLLHELLVRLSNLFACDTVAILLLDAAGEALVMRATKGLEEEVEQSIPIPLGRGFAGRIAAERQPVILQKVDETKVLSPVLREKGVQSLLGVPLLVEGRVIGVIHVGMLVPRRFTTDEVRLLQLAADRIALAVEHARLFAAEQAARAQAEEALQQRQQFLSVAAHELRTPLTGLIGNVQLLQRRTKRGATLPEQDQQILQVIEEQGLRLNNMVNMLLDLTRIQHGWLTIDRQPVDLVALVRCVVESVRPTLQRHTVKLKCAERQLAIVGDELRLEQAIANLVHNAIKFSPDGGEIQVQVESRDHFACITVADQGIGIATADLPHIFDPFYTVSSATTEHRIRMGVGLYMVKEIVTLHGGTVDVRSMDGQGSTFMILLPGHPDTTRDTPYHKRDTA